MIVRRCEDPAPLRALMNADPGETAYALGDLQPPLWDESEYWGAFDGDDLRGFVLLYHGFEIPALTMHGSMEAVRVAFDVITLADEVFCMAPARFLDQIAAYYDSAHIYPLVRMLVSSGDFRPPQSAALDEDCHLLRLKAADATRLNALYAQAAEPGEAVMAFLPSQIEQGVFCGVVCGDELIAAAGTHVASVQEGVGAIGNVFTAPKARRRGLGSITTAAVAQQLFADGIQHVVLNVKRKNTPAIRVYEKLGFREHCAFVEGPAKLKR
jgi:ribosomal protein S18 acetylase RimI-like enzyme